MPKKEGSTYTACICLYAMFIGKNVHFVVSGSRVWIATCHSCVCVVYPEGVLHQPANGVASVYSHFVDIGDLTQPQQCTRAFCACSTDGQGVALFCVQNRNTLNMRSRLSTPQLACVCVLSSTMCEGWYSLNIYICLNLQLVW